MKRSIISAYFTSHVLCSRKDLLPQKRTEETYPRASVFLLASLRRRGLQTLFYLVLSAKVYFGQFCEPGFSG